MDDEICRPEQSLRDRLRFQTPTVADNSEHLRSPRNTKGARTQPVPAASGGPWSSLAKTVLRLPGRRFPIKGWTQITEWLHPRITHVGPDPVYHNAFGVNLRLDLSDLIQRSIFYDAWECDELNLVVDVLRDGDVMLDIGANVGLFSLVAAKAVGITGEVHAFEPVPENCDRFNENLALNKFATVRLNRTAVTDRPGDVVLAIDAGMASSSGSKTSGCFTVSKLQNPVREFTAPAETIDSYVRARLNDRNIRFVKVDVEGAEPSVLRGMKATLKAHQVDMILLEVNLYTLSLNGYRISDIVEPLVRADYRLFRLGAGGILWPWSFRKEPSIPVRTVWASGSLRGMLQGLQDLSRLFNVVAIRADLPTLPSHHGVSTTRRLRRSSSRLPHQGTTESSKLAK